MKRSGLEDVPGFAETMATIRARFAVLEAETDAIFERLEPTAN